MIKTKERFSRVGILAVATGSAIGLGNIWRFPYSTYENGGGTFLFFFTLFSFTLGASFMLGEFLLGRQGRSDAYGAFSQLSKKKIWKYLGLLCILETILIMSYYSVVGGWTVKYLGLSLIGGFNEAFQADIAFENFTSDIGMPILCLGIFLACCCYIVAKGIKDGLERFSKILMPTLLIIIIFLDVYVLLLPNAWSGVLAFFTPDMSKVTGSMILEAFAQAFFSLSLGMGVMLTFGAFTQQKEDLVKLSFTIVLANTAISFFAGLLVFPTLSWAGLEIQHGTGLSFITLPIVFIQMNGGFILAILFFFLLFAAALTSALSLIEVPVIYFRQELRLSKLQSSLLTSFIVFLIGIACSLSIGEWKDVTILGKNIFDAIEYLTTSILLPLMAIAISMFIGWELSRQTIEKEIKAKWRNKSWFMPLLMCIFRYILPLAIFIVFIVGII